jgi:4-diphosphocytidyl-2-C-methyl-D-erythritol kinase
VTGARTRLAIAAPAKINLYLHITGRRPDGYHLIDSLMAFTEAGDRLVVRPADALTLEIEGPFAAGLGAGEDNLVTRAARALAERAGVRARARMTLVKNLPIASGIGGGSSDAAASLKALVALWRLDADILADAEWAAARLGADAPVCLFAAPAQVSGIGERIRPAASLPSCAVVLVNPAVAVPTGPVFARRAGPFSPAAGDLSAADLPSFVRALEARRNDLAAPALSLAPVIGASLEALQRAAGCRFARMSGSGATCFGLFDDDRAAAGAAVRIRDAHPEWWVQPTRFRAAPPTVEIAGGA